MPTVIINVSGGVIQEVMTDDKEVKVVLLDFDNDDEKDISEHYVSNILDKKDQWYPAVINNYRDSFMEQQFKWYNFSFDIKGVSREEALANLVEILQKSELEPEPELVDITCDLCHQTKKIDPNNTDFCPDVYFLGYKIENGACAECQKKYCVPNHVKGGFDAVWTKVWAK